MTPEQAFAELLGRIGANEGEAVLVSEEELASWSDSAVRALKRAGLLSVASPVASVVCPGCEEQCIMPVQSISTGGKRVASFVVCDKRDDINRVEVPTKRLRQWRCSAEAVCAFLAQALGLRPDRPRKADIGLYEIGLVNGKRRSQVVCLRVTEALELVVGQNAVPFAELMQFGDNRYSVDMGVVRHMVDISTVADSRYTPSSHRRESRKLKTQALHDAWKKAYRALKRCRPDMSDVWYSQQIAKTEAGSGRSADTIRKHMTR